MDANSDKRHTRWPGFGGLTLSQRLPVRPPSSGAASNLFTSNNAAIYMTDEMTQGTESTALVKRSSVGQNGTVGAANLQEPISGFLNVFQAGMVSLCVRRNGKVAALRAASRAEFAEIQALIRFSHKNVIQIFGYIQHPDINHIQHEYLEIALNEIIACPMSFSEEQVGYVCREVLSGLQFLESVGLEHTKIESSRVLLSQPNTVKIGDALSIRRKSPAVNISEMSFPAVGVGEIALDMMENGTLSENGDHAVALTHPENWTASASDFVRNTSCSPVELLLNHVFVNPNLNPNLTEAIVMGITCTEKIWTPPDECSV
ncbi:hypothetical protein TWF718_009709 [Orbilia javanica]|uniref:Protein kinase domain-containing protein n=1 Tax=Orbilia javanica TaxID=47235 RepID=A0AAN8MTW4_9PEZI